MNSMFNSVTSWFAGDQAKGDTELVTTKPQNNEQNTVLGESSASSETTTKSTVPSSEEKSADSSDSNKADKEPAKDTDASASKALAENDQENDDGVQTDVNLHEMSEKALQTAKEWGSYLYNFGKVATEQVAKTAKTFKDTMEEKTILGEFSKEQEKFVTEQREKSKQTKAAVPVWVGYNEEQAMKTQILTLSQDKRNFLRNPPAGVQFNFEYSNMYPIAMVMLEEDPKLKAMRFELVPKQIKEEMFWRNYFYRVSLIKQSAQLSTLAQAGSTEKVSKASHERPVERVPNPDNKRTDEESKESEDLSAGSPVEHEFVSDAFQSSDINDEELKKEMQQLHAGDKNRAEEEDIPEWERELQAELQEYEVLDDGNQVNDEDLEKEIIDQIEAESN